jgi:hypothetical protein
MRQLDLFSALQSSTEGIDTEFKSARGGMPGSFWESYSAMANTQGGTIVLRVAEKPTGLVWEGVPDAAQLRNVLWGQLNDRHKVSTNLLRDDDVRTVEDEGRQFVVVNVPRASRLQRPVFVGPKALAFPRALLPRVNARPEQVQIGVYLMLGMCRETTGSGQKHSILGSCNPAFSRLSRGKSQCNIAGKC